MEFLILPNKTLKPEELTLFLTGQAYVMFLPGSFQIYGNIDSIIGSLDFTADIKYTDLG